MEQFNRKSHWENIYKSKPLETVSWYQPHPETSLNFVRDFNLPKTAKIIDIGGGDSFFVDHLLELGYEAITVLDISDAAIQRARQRLGSKADGVKWIVSDILDFKPSEQYDFWHDRAAFHFLTEIGEINTYINIASRAIVENGSLVVGTFSESGPTKCSGIDIKQYSENTLTEQFRKLFTKEKCITVDHSTPFNTTQNFVFCSLYKN